MPITFIHFTSHLECGNSPCMHLTQSTLLPISPQGALCAFLKHSGIVKYV